MKIAITIFHVLLIFTAAYLLAKRWEALRSKLFWSGFLFHVAAGAGVGLVYLFYYSANDTWLYFEDAQKFTAVAHGNLWSYIKLLFDFSDELHVPGLVNEDFRALIFVKALSVFSLFSGDNYWLCTGYFSLMSFASSWFLFRKMTLYFPDSASAAALSFLLFPSVVFWSSGIEKETLTLTALYFLSGIFLQLFIDRKADWLVVFLSLFAAAILWEIKYYWAGVFFISAIAALAIQKWSEKSSLIKKYSVASFTTAFVAIAMAVSFLHPNFYLSRFLEVLVENHNAFVPLSSDTNLIHFYELKPTIYSVVINFPWALISGIFRPVIGEGQGMLGLFASIENFFILILFVSFIWNFKKRFNEPINILSMAVISYCVILCIFLALSTPNFGTLSRYRVGFLPFLIFILAYRNPLFDAIAKRIKN